MLPAAAAAAPGAAHGVTGPVAGVNSLSSVTCPTATTCVAVGVDPSLNGKSVIITAATGAAKAWSGKLVGQAMNAVACPGTSTCLAVADDAVATVAVSTGAMKVTAKPTPPAGGIVAMDSLACALNPATGAPGAAIALSNFDGTGLTCISATECRIVGFISPAFTPAVLNVTNGHPGTPASEPASSLDSIACATTALCYAVGSNSTGAIVDKV